MTQPEQEYQGPRCRGGEHCVDGKNIHDPYTRLKTGRLGAPVDHGGLCPGCTRLTTDALIHMPGHIPELSMLLPPSTSKRWRDPDMPAAPHVMTAPPLPIRPNIRDLQIGITCETTVWAEILADHYGLRWECPPERSTRERFRVGQACHLLRINLDGFLALPKQSIRARSLTTRRGDGHDPEVTTFYRNEIWTLRDGVDAALTMIEYHRQVTRHAGRHPGDRIHTPCPNCECLGLVREHRFNRVTCRVCHEDWTDDQHDTLTARMFAELGIER